MTKSIKEIELKELERQKKIELRIRRLELKIRRVEYRILRLNKKVNALTPKKKLKKSDKEEVNVDILDEEKDE